MKKLRISPNLKLPYEAVTQTFAILAMRGVGKTHTASVLAEEFSEAQLPFAVLDPTGAWWGLRASADGKAEGYPVTIIGGDHGDAPLEETAGKVIADMLVEESQPLVVDLSLLSKGAMRRFVADFGERLYQKNRDPLHLIIDEADAFAPQRPRPDEMKMLGAIDEIVRRGRIRGLGCTLVTQRSAVLNKDVLTQTEVLIVLRTAHPRDRAPVLEWMKVHATPDQLREVEASLAKLPRGDAWVMSAGWLDLFTRIHVRERRTFNSSATPTPGQRRVQPRAFARIEPKILQERLAAAIERQKASDPAALRRRITELERELQKKPAAAAAVVKVERVEVPVLREADVKRLEAAADRLDAASLAIRDALAKTARGVPASEPIREAARPIPEARTPKAAGPRPIPLEAPGELPSGERRILTAVAQHASGITRATLTALTGFKRSTRDRYLLNLKTAGCVDTAGALLQATPEGLARLGPDFEPLPVGPELLGYWRRELPSGERAILDVLAAAYPNTVDRETITEKTAFKRSTRDRYLLNLRTKQLVEESARGQLKARDLLFT